MNRKVTKPSTSSAMKYLLDHPELENPELEKEALGWRYLCFTVDDGYLKAALEQGCSHSLCHACEEEIRVGNYITLAPLEEEEDTKEGKTIGAVVHYDCRNKTPMGPGEWMAKYGPRKPEGHE